MAEIRLAEATPETIPVAARRGRPKIHPWQVVADTAYVQCLFQEKLRWRGLHPCIPERKGNRPRPDPRTRLHGYLDRWKTERGFACLHNFRRLVVRWKRLPRIFAALLILAFIPIYLRRLSVPYEQTRV